VTARATFTQAQIARAIRAAEACGKVALLTPLGIVFAESGSIALPSPETDVSDYDRWKARKNEARREGRS
jgi:hypothetical protein